MSEDVSFVISPYQLCYLTRLDYQVYKSDSQEEQHIMLMIKIAILLCYVCFPIVSHTLWLY